ncbi:ATP-dependent helicase [Peptoniphilus equinus]|uniref:DNA 3'-5' helicase n=1 Tax=Peptoniphilus equinus TaxID=3016343 RepID=A0ABY7QRT1_9FIRM|nr:ATP-dependent helicase [Peptoniphilus equinus]WBW49482.1 ATP-dependent helicase [Peptoniphilus equinus]
MKLSSEQLCATEHLTGPALTLAVPGSGKTTVLLNRLLRLMARGVDPSRILTITFSKSAQLDMKRRFGALSQASCPFMTLHAFSYRILRDYYRKKGRDMRLIDEQSGKKFEIIRRIYGDLFNRRLSDENLEHIVTTISAVKNAMLPPTDSTARIKGFTQIYQAYETYKNENSLIDFDDMILQAIAILKSDKALLKKYQSRYDFYQLDEGQDTSRAQFELLHILSAPAHNLFMVADDDQSIYAFRGASPDYLLHINKVYPDITLYYLKHNYRSSKNIVDLSHQFISQNTRRFVKDMRSSKDYASPVKIFKVRDTSHQYDLIVKTMAQAPEKSYAVLYRNNLSSLGLVEYLERHKVDFNIHGNRLRFFRHFVVTDILNIIHFSYNTTDSSLFSSFYYKIRGYISKKHIAYIKAHSGSDVLKTLLGYPDLPSYYRDTLFSLMHDFKVLRSLSVADQIEYVLNALGYRDYLVDFSEKFGFSHTSLLEFAHMLKYIAGSVLSFDELLGRLQYLEELLKKPQLRQTRCTLSTIHSVKGLEYDTVFIIDAVDGVLPLPTTNRTDAEEERRLFYVAMTRAREELYILAPKIYNGKLTAVSAFIDELSHYS